MIDQNTTHGLGGDGKEVGSILGGLPLIQEPQVGLMDQSGGLKGVFRSFGRCRVGVKPKVGKGLATNSIAHLVSMCKFNLRQTHIWLRLSR